MLKALTFITLLLGSTLCIADLKVTDAEGKSITYSFSELDGLVGAIEREIPDDYLFKRAKRYVGYDIHQLFTALNLPKDQQYLLVCTDGYEIEFDGRKLSDERFTGLLARADIEAAEDIWLPYKVGVNPTALSPFYLAWAAETSEAQQIARQTFPWPYALNEIRIHDPDALHAEAKPGAGASKDVMHGFEVFTHYCMKCHKINEAGGSLGPELTTNPAITFANDEQLADVIVNITRYYPSSKMPTYVNVLSDEETDAMIAYLRYINEAAFDK